MTREVVRTLLIALVLDVVVTDISVHSDVCRSLCVCDIWYGLQHASCTGHHLYSIHTGVPSITQALDLSNNSISVLNNYELADAELSNLKYLNLSVNSISEIGLNAFNGLSELKVLDLSQNHLYYLLSDIFMPAKSLRILRLSKNNFNSHVPKLKCPWLTDLTLDSCKIGHVPVDTFIGLPNLRNLDLSNNLMIQLESFVLESTKLLRTLSIQGNPWLCDKLMHDLQMYLTQKSIQYDAVCTTNSVEPKNAEPKKFEKMIIYNPRIKYEKHRPSISNIKKNTPKKTLVSSPAYNNTSTCVNATRNETSFKILNAISPYYLFATGFLLGSACSIFICYIWLSRKILCRRRYRERNDIQRVSLLQNLWQFEDVDFNEITSCPDTPPPPYREVMQRPGLYRNPSDMTNLNNNIATTSTQYT
ncbi:amphoterin-induced protein 2-like [Linepithema humile]|uniref:amphoterin-induced protein 2-like n=1 Tax=Linepithema humile TaxID=83485 RepID=UPI00062359AC|nr:PREDICTED: amphoterin-induced protein 2-like [Linepithema humile]